MGLKGKTALITGGSSGIGKAIALAFLKEGAKVLVFDIQKPDFDAKFFKVDVRDEKQIEKAFTEVKELNILVNNAGVYEPGFVEETTNEQLDKVIDINFKGTYLMSKHSMPLLRKSKGNIINVASALGVNPENESPAYCSSKAAVIMLTKCMAQANASKNVRVNAILPGPIDTPLLRKSFKTQKELDEYAKTNPMKKIGSAEEVARVALFLASDDSSFITSSTYEVDGGETSSRISL